jgi:hypothetical protein
VLFDHVDLDLLISAPGRRWEGDIVQTGGVQGSGRLVSVTVERGPPLSVDVGVAQTLVSVLGSRHRAETTQ